MATGSGGTAGGGRTVSDTGVAVGMKRSFSPTFQVSSFGSVVAVAGIAVERVSAASVQSSPDSCETCPENATVTLPVSELSARS